MKKITLKEFWNSKENLVIHCDTKEKADKLLKAFDRLGKEWRSGTSYLVWDCWEYKENTCYDNTNGYSSVDYYKSKKYKIYEFDEVDLEA